MLKNQLYFFTFLLLIAKSLSDAPTIWTSSELITYLNDKKAESSSLVYDPNFLIKESEKDFHYLELITEDLSTRFNVHTYLIILNEIDEKSFDTKELLSNYKYPQGIDSKTAVFVISIKTNHDYKIEPGESLKEIYNQQFYDEMIKEIDQFLDKGPNYKNMQIVLRRMRNVYVIPEDNWTSENLISEYLKYEGKCSYLYYDPTLSIDIRTYDKVENYFTDSFNKKVYVFLFAINDYNHKQYTEEKLFFDELYSNLNKILDEQVDIKNTVIALYDTGNKFFDLKIGDSFLSQLTDEDIANIKYPGDRISDYPTSIKFLLENIRYYIAGEIMGWTATMFNSYLKTNISSEYMDYYFIYKDKLAFNKIQTNYIDDLQESLLQNTMNTYFLVLGSLDSKYNNLASFYEEFKDLVSGPKIQKENMTYVLFSLKDNSFYFKIESNNIKYFTKDVLTEINDETNEKLKSQEKYEVFLYVLKAFRFRRIIIDDVFTSVTLADYFVDKYNAPNFTIFDENNTLELKEREEISKYFEEIYDAGEEEEETRIEDSVSIYYFIVSNISENYTKETLPSFNEELFKNLDYFKKPTDAKTLYFVQIVYFVQYEEFHLYRSDMEKKQLTTDTLNFIIEQSKKETGLKNQSLIIAKYLKYYLLQADKEWDGESIGQYFKDFIGKVYKYFFDPARSIDKKLIIHLNSYLNQLVKYKAHIFCFVLKKEINSVIIDEIIKYLELPSDITFEDTILITFEPIQKDINFHVGKNLQSNITEEIMNNYIKEIKPDMINSTYKGFKLLLSKISTNFVSEINWTPENLNDFILANYDQEEIKSYLIFDHYSQFQETEEMNILNKYLINLTTLNKTSTNIFILNKIDTSKYANGSLFLSSLYALANSFFKDRKECSLLILYSLNDKKLSSYPGTKTERYLTINSLSEISKQSQSIMEFNLTEGFNMYFDQVNPYMKIKAYWEPNEISQYITEQYHNPDTILFDLHDYLTIAQHQHLSDKLNEKSQQNAYVLSFIMSDISEEQNNMDDYIKKVVESYNIPQSIKKELIYFIVVAGYQKELGIMSVNDNKGFLKGKDVQKGIEEARLKLKNSNMYESLDGLFSVLPNNKSSKSGDKKWKIIIVSLSVVFIIAVIILIVLRLKSKNKFSTETEKEDLKPILGKNDLLI